MKIPTYSPRLECPSANPYLNLSFNSRNGVRKRHRTHFTIQQIEKLESIFKQTTNPHRELVVQLSTMLNLTDKNISIWFKNRRAKCRREQLNQKGRVNDTTESVKKSTQKPVSQKKSSWAEHNTYPNYWLRDETLANAKLQSTSYSNDVNAYHKLSTYKSDRSQDSTSENTSYLAPHYYETTGNVKMMNHSSFTKERNTSSSVYDTNYFKSASQMENSQSNSIELPSRTTNEAITPPLPTDLTRDTSYNWTGYYPKDTIYQYLRNDLTDTTTYPRSAFCQPDMRNLSWYSSFSQPTNYTIPGTSSIDSSSLANTSDSSSASSLSSLQETESSPSWVPYSSSSITQSAVQSSVVPQYVPQTTYTYQFPKTGREGYQSTTPSSLDKMATDRDTAREFNFSSLLSNM